MPGVHIGDLTKSRNIQDKKSRDMTASRRVVPRFGFPYDRETFCICSPSIRASNTHSSRLKSARC